MACRHVVFLEMLQPLHQLVHCLHKSSWSNLTPNNLSWCLTSKLQSSFSYSDTPDKCTCANTACSKIEFQTSIWYNIDSWDEIFVWYLRNKVQAWKIHHKILTYLQKLDQSWFTVSCAPNQWSAATAFVWHRFSIASYRDFLNQRKRCSQLTPLLLKTITCSFVQTRSAFGSFAQSSTARLSSPRDCGENTDNRVRSVWMCERG